MFLKSTKWTFILTIVLVIYLAVVLPVTASRERHSHYGRYRVEVNDPAATRFVTADDIKREFAIDSLIKSSVIDSLNLLQLQRALSAMPEIEHASVSVAANGDLVLRVTPMIPVARVFDRNSSYYVNSTGKKVDADVKYHIDVPVVLSDIPVSAGRSPLDLLPLLRHIASRPELNALVSDITLNRRGNIFIRPVIRGHVINFGDTTDVADKFDRLLAFYRQVSPLKGWDYYDTISVKWRGQVVAKKNMKKFAPAPLPEEDALFDFIDDDATMSADLPDSLINNSPTP